MDPVAWWFKMVFLLAGMVTVLLSRDLLDGRVGRARARDRLSRRVLRRAAVDAHRNDVS